MQNRKYLRAVEDLQEVTDRRDKHKLVLMHMRKQRLKEFWEGFRIISDKLKEMYQVTRFKLMPFPN